MADVYDPHNGGAVLKAPFDEAVTGKYTPAPDVMDHDFTQLSNDMKLAVQKNPPQKQR